MTNSPPPDPRSSQTALGFDEFIGIFVAFTTIGGILFWSISHKGQGFDITSLVSPSTSPSTQATATASPQATASLVPVLPVPAGVPTELPQVLTPAPSPSAVRPGLPLLIPLPATVPAPATPTPVPATPTPVAASPTPAPPQPVNFVDVPQDYWARPFIDALSARAIVNGVTTGYFRPDQLVTRAQFATMLQQAFDKTPGQSTTAFKDVPSDFWAAPAIDKEIKAGFLKGYPGNVFQPQQPIPRVQVLVALVTGLNLAPKSPPSQTLQTYQDAGQVPNYATEKIAAATEAGLVVNYPNPKLLKPNQNATRAEVAAVIYQALVQAGKAQPIQSQYIAGH